MYSWLKLHGKNYTFVSIMLLCGLLLEEEEEVLSVDLAHSGGINNRRYANYHPLTLSFCDKNAANCGTPSFWSLHSL